MGLFSKETNDSTDTIYENVKKFLKPKDNKIHIILINNLSKYINKNFQCVDNYTIQVDEILTNMQNDGYEIIDIKFNSFQNLPGQTDGFHTLITYK